MNRETIQKDNTKVTELLNSMDENIAQSFNYKQRKALNKSLNMRDWRKHSIDFRPTIALPLFPWSFYLVFLAGANKRELTNGERFIAFFMFFVVIFMFGLLAICVGLISIYLLKSWLGIDLFPNESLGIWDKFKHYF